MKSLKLIVIGMVLFFGSTVQAQVSVNVNIGSPPMWGPAGYNDVHYYYLPDVQAYYDVPASMFIYYERGAWIHRAYLPSRYRNYDLYGGYKVAMTDYRGNKPYTHFREYRTRYARGYRGHEQHNIGERPGRGNNNDRYSRESNRGNKDYNRDYKKGNKHDNGSRHYKGNGNGNGGGHDKGNGNGKGHGRNK